MTEAKKTVSARAVVGGLVSDLRGILEDEASWGTTELPRTDEPLGELPSVVGTPTASLTPKSQPTAPPRAMGPTAVASPEPARRPPKIEIPEPRRTPASSEAPGGGAPPGGSRSRGGPLELPAPARISGVVRGAEGLERIRAELGDCQRCNLAKQRNSIVFGEGLPNASLLFVGEGPGFDEDRQGRPFVGKAGGLLDRMIQAMGLSRESVYIANVVKCRPPRNRDPEWDERLECRPFLLGQVEAISPKIVVALGKVAAQTLLETDELISRMRGRWQVHPHFPNIRVMPTYHPAALLRNQALKRPVWNDLQLVMAALRES